MRSPRRRAGRPARCTAPARSGWRRRSTRSSPARARRGRATSTRGATAPRAGRRRPRPRGAPPSCRAPCASPSASSTSPPTSSMEPAGTPRRGNTCGRIAVRKKTCVRHPRTSRHTVAISRSDAVPARACALAARPRPGGHAPGHQPRDEPEHHRGEEKGQAEPEARRGQRARRGPQHLAERHAELDLRHLAPHVAARPARHDEGERGHRAHGPEQAPGEEDLAQAAGERHHDEARGLQPLRPHERALGIAAAREPSRDRRGDHGDERADARG